MVHSTPQPSGLILRPGNREVTMKIKQLFVLGASLLAISLSPLAVGQETRGPYVRLAELEIDPAQLDAFKAAVTDGVEAAVRLEPGVLVLYAVSEKDNPNRIRVFEMYTDATAYATHLETPHFKKFRATTDKMVLSRKLFDAVPVVLGAKAQAAGTSR
jgi:quinol monooxygenase YgiN